MSEENDKPTDAPPPARRRRRVPPRRRRDGAGSRCRRAWSPSCPRTRRRILLPLFEGPLDLLLYLIKREKIDIHDIPIAPITRQYMEYLDLMQELNLDVAGEFMVMAATLIHIKSKMLVPIEPTEAEGDEEYVDPREELVRRLLEFQRYKEAAGVLHQQAQIRAAQWTRPDTVLPSFDDAGEEMLEAGLYDLISAFKELLDRRKALIAHEVDAEGPPVEQRMDELLAMIKEGESLEFLELFAALDTKAEMIVTFLALLELIRLKRVRVYQRGMFGPIRVFRPVGRRPRARRRPRSQEREAWTRRTKRRTRKGSRAPESRRRRRGSALEAYVPGRPSPSRTTWARSPRSRTPARRLPPRPRPRRAASCRSPQVRAVLEALVFASPQPITPKEIGRVLQGVPREDWQKQLAGAAGGLRARRARAPDRRDRGRASRSPPGPSTTTGSASCSTRARRPGCRSRPSRRSPSSPTSSRSPCPRSSSCAA